MAAHLIFSFAYNQRKMERTNTLSQELAQIREAMSRLDNSNKTIEPMSTSQKLLACSMDASSTGSLPGSPRSNHHPKSIPEILNFPNAASVALCGNATSTKAVLSALRALQDKIRRLEAERQSAVDQVPLKEMKFIAISHCG